MRSTRSERRSSGPASVERGTPGSRRTPESVAERYRAGKLDVLDVIRQNGVILEWGTGELLA